LLIWVSGVSILEEVMSMLKNLTIVAALLVAGASPSMAQNGLPTGGEHPVAGGAAGGPARGHFYHPRTGHRIHYLHHPTTGHRIKEPVLSGGIDTFALMARSKDLPRSHHHDYTHVFH
jgi:hypothetical protein